MMTTLGLMTLFGVMGLSLMRAGWLWQKPRPQAVPIRVRVTRW